MPSENRTIALTGRTMETATLNGRTGAALAVADHTRSALDFAHALLQETPQGPAALAGLLLDLAHAFGATGAGLAASPETAPVLRQRVRVDARAVAPDRWPWEEQPDLLGKALSSPVAVTAVAADGRSWLLASVPAPAGGWLLWVEADGERAWSQGEAAALPLIGQAVARVAASPAGLETEWAHLLEKARLQANLENAARLTAKLAHDFGNVLTGILGFAELTLGQLPADSLPRRYVEEVLLSAQQGARWVQKLQLFGRRRSRNFLPASLHAAVAAEEARVRPAWGPSVALHVALPADLPPLAIEGESLREALAQVLDNAREALTAEGVVTLSARVTDLGEADCRALFGGAVPGRYIEVTVTDTGSGLAPEVRRRLFGDLFFSTKLRHRGLGLALVYGILQTYRGGLRFGPDPAQGTAVRLFLPAAASAVPPGLAGPRPQGERVLVVDDDPLIVRFVTTVLESAGYRTESAAGGAEALARYTAAAEPFRLVLTDVLMPQVDGYELARRLRQQDPRATVLFLSNESPSPSAPPDVLGRFGLLAKPFRAEALLQAVRAALGWNGRPVC